MNQECRHGSNTKGQAVIDLLVLIVVLFIMGVTLIVGYKVLKDVNTDVQADPDIAQVAKSDLGNLTTNYPAFMDNTFVTLLALLWVALIVTSFLIDSHPIFFILTVILLVFVFIAGMILSNTYQDISGDESFSTEAAAFPKMNWVFQNFLPVLIVMAFSALLALYAKARI